MFSRFHLTGGDFRKWVKRDLLSKNPLLRYFGCTRFLMREASSKRDCLSVRPSARVCVCHTFLQICKVYVCDVIMYLFSHHLALRSCSFTSNTFISNTRLRLPYIETRVSENIKNWITRPFQNDCTHSK